MASKGRYKKIVVPTDCSGWGNAAIPHAAEIALAHGSEIILLFVFQTPASEFIDQIALAGQDEQIQRLREQYKQQLMSMRGQLRDQKLNARVQYMEGPGAAHLICDYINSEDVDLVVMSTHGRTGLARFLFGSVARKVMEGTQVPVMLIRPEKE